MYIAFIVYVYSMCSCAAYMSKLQHGLQWIMRV